jgi:prepilin-type N-terminal cleavage/methylation domain-containing protein
MKKQLTRGFTLIELLVVIAIIGILSSVVLASLNSARQKSRDARRISDIKQIQLALELYFDSASPNEYPDALADLITGGYLAQEPTDPSTGSNYVYDNYADAARTACAVATGACTYYQLGATLEQVGHTVLDGDSDIDDAVGSGPDGLSAEADCADDAGAATAAEDLCYDVTP